jgi:signal transduction histidine kinase/tetratricopeptide (TPR) repeat protein
MHRRFRSTHVIFLTLLVGLQSPIVLSQTKNLDSLKAVLTTQNGKDKALTLLWLCWEYRFVNADSARTYAFEALKLSQQKGLVEYEAEAFSTIGVTYEAQGNYEEAVTYGQQSLALYRKANAPSQIANTLNNLGIAYDEKGDYEKALQNYYEALKIYETQNNEGKTAMILTNIGIVLKAQKEYKNVVGLYRKASVIYQKLNDSFGLAAAYANLGSVYLNLSNYDSSLYYSLLAGREFEEKNIKQFLPTTWTNVAIAYEKTDRPKESKDFFLKAKKLHEEYKNKKELSYTLSRLAQLESKLGNSVSSLKYAQEALALAESSKALEQIMQAHEALAEGNASASDFQRAYREHIQFTNYKDSLFQEQKSKQLVEMQTKYETEKSKQQILFLNQENNIKKAAIERNYFIIGGLMLLLLMLLLLAYLWRYRTIQKQKAIAQEQKVRLREAQINAVIESQEQERKRFASDLHDGMGQLIVALQLTIQSIKGTQTQEKTVALVENSEQLLSDIQSEIRNIAFNLMPPVLVKEGLIPAIRELIRRINKASQLKVVLTVHDVPKRFTNVVEISVYRILQELISNTLKHSSATELTISFTGHSDEVILTLEDNGAGYDLPAFQNSTQSNGWRTIQTRLNLIKGSIDFDVVPERKNNTIIIQLPTSSTPAVASTQNTETSVF